MNQGINDELTCLPFCGVTSVWQSGNKYSLQKPYHIVGIFKYPSKKNKFNTDVSSQSGMKTLIQILWIKQIENIKLLYFSKLKLPFE